MKYYSTGFGLAADLELPDDVDAIVVCIDRMYGHEPKTLLLPHQLYRKTIKELLEFDDNIESITVMPIRNKEKIEITRKDL